MSTPVTSPLIAPDSLPLSPRVARFVVYHTFDEVNLDAMRHLAGGCGLAVRHREPRDGVGTGPALIFDADFWWTSREDRASGLDELLNREVFPAFIAVHGWQLDDEQIDRLNAAGVLAVRKLDEALLAAVARRVNILPIATFLAG